MPHLDEGLINALLDGELDAADAKAAEAHLAGCPTCAAKLVEVRGLLAESDRLVGMVEVEEVPVPMAMAAAAAPAVAARAVASRPRLGRMRQLAWAASVVLAVGLGYGASQLAERGRPANAIAPVDQLQPADKGAATSSAPIADSPAAAPETKAAAETKEEDARSAPRAKLRAPVAAPRSTLMAAPTPSAVPAAPPPAREEASADERRDRAAGFAAGTGFRTIDLDEAARRLGGPIRLLDGLTPRSIAVAPGVAVAGADPTREVVRLVYRDAHGTEMTLDQQRIDTVAKAQRRAASRGLVANEAPALQTLNWTDGAFRLQLSAPVDKDSLERLRDRVR